MLLIFAALGDIKSRKIRNKLVVGLWLLNFLLAWQRGGAMESLSYVGNCFVWGLLPFVLYRFGSLGAGDVKLIAVVVAGLESAQWFPFWIGMLGSAAVMAIWKLRKCKNKKETVPLAVAICIGYGTAWVAEKGGWI